jgi:hypothetical protein
MAGSHADAVPERIVEAVEVIEVIDSLIFSTTSIPSPLTTRERVLSLFQHCLFFDVSEGL